jgi:hypothetical protein
MPLNGLITASPFSTVACDQNSGRRKNTSPKRSDTALHSPPETRRGLPIATPSLDHLINHSLGFTQPNRIWRRPEIEHALEWVDLGISHAKLIVGRQFGGIGNRCLVSPEVFAGSRLTARPERHCQRLRLLRRQLTPRMVFVRMTDLIWCRSDGVNGCRR